MASVFSKIVSGEIPCYKIAEDENYFAFLDINPIAKGHTLVIPKKEVDYLFDVGDDLLSGMLPFCKTVARAIEQVVSCKRVGLAVIGLEVPHAHIHLVPLQGMHDIDFRKPKLSFSEAEFNDMAAAIRDKL